MTAWNCYFTQYEDYKGLLAELRFWDRARPAQEIRSNWMKPVADKESGLVGHFPLDENAGALSRDKFDSARTITLHNSQPESWSRERPLEQKQ
jgi:hypothetical protein